MTGTWDEKRRLLEIVADARKLLAAPPLTAGTADDLAIQLARRAGALEATLAMVCDSAEIVAAANSE